jgi:hypothetical protein
MLTHNEAILRLMRSMGYQVKAYREDPNSGWCCTRCERWRGAVQFCAFLMERAEPSVLLRIKNRINRRQNV